jgi:hypothetical protein
MFDFHSGTMTLDSPLISKLLYHVIWEERRYRITIRGSWSRQVLQKIIILFWLIWFFTAALQLCMTGIQIIKHTAFIATFWVIVRRSIRNHWSIDANVMCASWTGFCYSTLSSIFWGNCMSVCMHVVWMREKDRRKKRQRQKETETQGECDRDRDTHRVTDSGTQRQKETKTEIHTEWDRDTETQTENDRDRDTETQRQRQTGTERYIDRETEGQIDTERQRDRQTPVLKARHFSIHNSGLRRSLLSKFPFKIIKFPIQNTAFC